MSFNKLTTFKIEKTDLEVIDVELVKTASVNLPEGHQYDPDYIYLKVKAVSAGEAWGCNKNFDYFPEKELKEYFKTFLTAHVFKNHENKKIEDSIGDVLHAEWNDDMKAVYLIIRIDKRIAPTIVRGFEKGFMTDVSMGCRVDHVICSYCGKTARTKLDYCDHLKTMKGKIMDNGKKVYEINIGPKFHDISAVLNGAELTAKAEGIYMVSEKKACDSDGLMEKKASFDDLTMDVVERVRFSNQQLSDKVNIVASSMEKVASSDTITEKSINDAKSKVETEAKNNALSEFVSDKMSSVEKVIDIIKNSYTEYMDKEKCMEIGKKLRDMAKSERASIESVIEQFLKVIDIAAINLSPKEMHYIVMEALDRDSIDINHIPFKCSPDDAEKSVSSICDLAEGDSVSSCISSMSGILGHCDKNGYDNFSENPMKRIRVIISSSNPASCGDALKHKIMSGIVGDMLESRSNHRKYLMPRIQKITIGQVKPMDNSNEFLPIQMTRLNSANEFSLPMMLSALLSSAHENERVASFNSGELFDGMSKLAHYFSDNRLEKVAGPMSALKDMKSNAKIIFNGIPVIYSYSALQRSRLNNGENISSMNRFIAENPTNAAFLYSLAAPAAVQGIKAAKPIIKDALGTMAKLASDMFANQAIDSEMIKSGYSKKDVASAKYACLLDAVGVSDMADDFIAKSGIDHHITHNYLKTASACYKIDIEKQASNTDINSFKFQLGESPESIALKDAIIAGRLLATMNLEK